MIHLRHLYFTSLLSQLFHRCRRTPPTYSLLLFKVCSPFQNCLRLCLKLCWRNCWLTLFRWSEPICSPASNFPLGFESVRLKVCFHCLWNYWNSCEPLVHAFKLIFRPADLATCLPVSWPCLDALHCTLDSSQRSQHENLFWLLFTYRISGCLEAHSTLSMANSITSSFSLLTLIKISTSSIHYSIELGFLFLRHFANFAMIFTMRLLTLANPIKASTSFLN